MPAPYWTPRAARLAEVIDAELAAAPDEMEDVAYEDELAAEWLADKG